MLAWVRQRAGIEGVHATVVCIAEHRCLTAAWQVRVDETVHRTEPPIVFAHVELRNIAPDQLPAKREELDTVSVICERSFEADPVLTDLPNDFTTQHVGAAAQPTLTELRAAEQHPDVQQPESSTDVVAATVAWVPFRMTLEEMPG